MKDGVKISTMITKDSKEILNSVSLEGYKIGTFIDKAIKNEFKRLTKDKTK